MTSAPFLLTFCLFGFCLGGDTQTPATITDMPIEEQRVMSNLVPLPEVERLGSGAYLASRFAQQNQDWKSANAFIEPLLEKHKDAGELRQRAMILAMGAGEMQRAVILAREIEQNLLDKETKDRTPTDSLSLMVAQILLVADAIAQDNAKEAQTRAKSLPNDQTANFIRPFLEGWIAAMDGKLKVTQLKANTIQLYHAILISDYLGNYSEIEKMLEQSILSDLDNPADIERIADLYAHVGLKKRAIDLYKKVQKAWPDDESIPEKIKAVEDGAQKPLFEKIPTAKIGIATAFHDIASALHNDYNYESARIFANMALMLAPDISEPHILLAQISARHGQYQDAIANYQQIKPSYKNYVETQFKIVELLEDSGQEEKALEALKALEAQEDSADVQMNIGDFYRRQENFAKALEAYNRAAEKLVDPVPAEYWGLYYAQGICHEQLGNWPEAEKALKAALELQPDHPYVLNHLGYGWADQGIHLDQAYELIARAVELRPDDGYIVDSLGWVLFKRGDLNRAVQYLEKAVALLPYEAEINDHLGDAYWRIGRHREARFQWLRAKNHAKKETDIQRIEEKLVNGLPDEITRIGDNSHQMP